MSKLLYDEDVMVRAVFHADPQRLAKRMKSIEKQREALMKAFNDAVNTAVGNLDEKTSTAAQIEKASELLEEAFRQKGGDAMSDVQELQRLKAMREKVTAVRAAVGKRGSVAPASATKPVEGVLTPEAAAETNERGPEAEKLTVIADPTFLHEYVEFSDGTERPVNVMRSAIRRLFKTDGHSLEEATFYVMDRAPMHIGTGDRTKLQKQDAVRSTEDPSGIKSNLEALLNVDSAKEHHQQLLWTQAVADDASYKSGQRIVWITNGQLDESEKLGMDFDGYGKELERIKKLCVEKGITVEAVFMNAKPGGEMEKLLKEHLGISPTYFTTKKDETEDESEARLEKIIRTMPKARASISSPAPAPATDLPNAAPPVTPAPSPTAAPATPVESAPNSNSNTESAEGETAVQVLSLPVGGEGMFTLPVGWELAETVTRTLNGHTIEREVPINNGDTIMVLREVADNDCLLKLDGKSRELNIRVNSFMPVEFTIDGTRLRVEPKIPKAIGGFSVDVQDPQTLLLSSSKYSLQIHRLDELHGYYLWDFSPDGYHYVSSSAEGRYQPNEDPLGFFATFDEVVSALEKKVGGKPVTEKMKEWSERNTRVMGELRNYFNAPESLTKQRGWTLNESGSFTVEGGQTVGEIDLLRRDENYIRISRTSDVSYGKVSKEYATVEDLINDVPSFFEKKELPPLSSVLGRKLTVSDMRVLDERMSEIVNLKEEQIVSLLDALDAFDTGGDSWARTYRARILPSVATKSVRLLRRYAEREGEYQRTGALGYNAGYTPGTVDVELVATNFVNENPRDTRTLFEAGLALQSISKTTEARSLLERALRLGDLSSGIVLMAINKGNISGMRPYAKQVLAIARKQKDIKFVEELVQQLRDMEEMEPETPALPDDDDTPSASSKPSNEPGTSSSE